MTSPNPGALAAPSKRKLVLTTAVALAIAALIVVAIVLPAEYGIDFFGTGRALGLNALSRQASRAVPAPAGATMYKPVQQGPIAWHSAPYKTDTARFSLGPYEYVEYKYRLEKGASMVFSWTASAAVIHDFHGEADGVPKGQAESFDKKSRSEGHGAFTAPFPGISGWYWENPGGEPITVAVTTAGFYSAATEFRMDRSKHAHDLTDLRPGPASTFPLTQEKTQ